MNRFTDYRLGARDVVLLLAELHRRGYECLRFCGNVSPNGAAYRVSLAHRDAMDESGYELEGKAIWHASLGSKGCGVPLETLADDFLREYAERTDLLKAKAGDSEYAQWFRQVVELARRDIYPSPRCEYQEMSLRQGYVATVGGADERLPLPPTPPRSPAGMPSARTWVESASQVAKHLHMGQVDKAGVPYFEGHLSSVSAMGRDWRERVVGYLHDSIEDTECTLDSVLSLLEEKAGALLSPRDRYEIERALRLLDHHSASSREAYIQGIATSPLATAVKLHDLTHNMDLSRLPNPSPRDYRRLERYKREYTYLSAHLRPPTYLD